MTTSLLASLLLLQFQMDRMYSTLILYVGIAAIFYFVLFRPQQAQRKAQEATLRQLKRGDEIVTAGGIVGEVVHVAEKTAGTPGPEDRITIRTGESRIVVERARVARIVGGRGAATPSA